ncbi:hypothetical protein Tco_1060658, partial [Tanacetum coccineum]
MNKKNSAATEVAADAVGFMDTNYNAGYTSGSKILNNAQSLLGSWEVFAVECRKGRGYRGTRLWGKVWVSCECVLERWFGAENRGKGGMVFGAKWLRYTVMVTVLK